MNDETKLGTGMKFPPQINPATGKIEMVSGYESIKESIYLILMTQKRERFIHPDFGSELLKFTFMDNNESVFRLMESNLEMDIRRGDSRVEKVRVTVEPQQEEGYLTVAVDYTVRGTKQEEHMDIPYHYSD